MQIATPHWRSQLLLAKAMVCRLSHIVINQIMKHILAQAAGSKPSQPSRTTAQVVQPVTEAVGIDKGKFFFYIK
jgi:hypothetical protein